MLSTNTHYQLHAARQRELESDAQRYRISSKIAKDDETTSLGQRIIVNVQRGFVNHDIFLHS